MVLVNAYEQQYPSAEWALSVIYHDGLGVDQDTEQAFAWARKAAEHGDLDAQHWLGNRYESGTGVKQDFDQALAWFSKAAERDHAPSQTMLGVSRPSRLNRSVFLRKTLQVMNNLRRFACRAAKVDFYTN